MLTTRRRLAVLAAGSLAAAGLARGAPAFAAAGRDAPNVFISPHGRPYRAVAGAAYPIGAWFGDADRNGDGKLDLTEFEADAAAFFDFLDLKGDGVLDTEEIAFYEHRVAPEVLGQRVTVLADGRTLVAPPAPGLWLAQMPGPLEGGPFGPGNREQSPYGAGGPGKIGADPQGGVIVPKDVMPHPDAPNPVVGTGGASPYSLIGEPEPVTAADPAYVTDGVVRRERFLAHARANFALLDPARAGYLTLASLPPTPVQKLLAGARRAGL